MRTNKKYWTAVVSVRSLQCFISPDSALLKSSCVILRADLSLEVLTSATKSSSTNPSKPPLIAIANGRRDVTPKVAATAWRSLYCLKPAPAPAAVFGACQARERPAPPLRRSLSNGTRQLGGPCLLLERDCGVGKGGLWHARY